VNEIPIEERYSLNNMIFFALIIQQKKPNYGLVLYRMVKQLQAHFIKGCMLQIQSDERKIVVRGLVTVIILDIGERGAVLNMKNSGFFSCHTCEVTGEFIAGAVRFCDLNFIARTPCSFRNTTFEVAKRQQRNPNATITIKGIHGHSFPQLLPFFAIPRSIPIDPMHTYCYGVTETLIKMFVDCDRKLSFCF